MASQPHFFKIIMSETLQSRRLRIPRKFAREHREALSNQLALKLPSGFEWKVELNSSDNKVWLDNGWHEFAEYCNLEEGQLLVFKYVGGSCFHTLIFDKSATEIDYPRNIVIKKESENVEEPKNDAIVEIPEEFLRSKRRREKSAAPNGDDLQPPKRKKTGKSCHPRSNNFDQGDELRSRQILATNKVKALHTANDFRSSNPFFRVTAYPSMVQNKYNLRIPTNFARKHLKQTIDEDISIKVSDGRTWPVTLYWSKGKCNYINLWLKGWKAVAQENHLLVGDVCIFELIQDDKIISFNLHMFPPQSDEENIANRVKLEKRKVQSISALEQARNFTSRNPFFTVVMGPSYVKSRPLNIPSSFVKRYLKALNVKNCDVILRTSDGRTWSTKFLLRFGSILKVEISSGWFKFKREKNLKIADVCVFELIKEVGKIISFNVFIFRCR